MSDVAAAYSARADEYAAAIGTMDAVHPLDRVLVEAWARSVSGPIVDAGCGPGHWTAHLAGLGADVRGVDLVPEFVAHARAAHPGVAFESGSIETIDVEDGALGGLLSWFSTIHHPPTRIAAPIAEFARVLRPGGMLLLGYFCADTIDRFDHAVTPAYRWPEAALGAILEECGFAVVETHQRSERGRRRVGAMIGERLA